MWFGRFVPIAGSPGRPSIRRSIQRVRAEEVLASAGIDVEGESIKMLLQGATQPDGSIGVDGADYDNVLLKVPLGAGFVG